MFTRQACRAKQLTQTICVPASFQYPSIARAPFLITRSFSKTMASNLKQHSNMSSTGDEGWKFQPPYRMHESDEKFDVKHEASCHCGNVQYQLSRDEPLASKICHCSTCQGLHSAPFQLACIFHKTDINFTHGHHNLEWHDPSTHEPEHALPCKVRCNNCRAAIMDEGRNMILVFPSLIKFKDQATRNKFRGQFHIFYNERIMDMPDNLPKWAGMNESSELVDEGK